MKNKLTRVLVAALLVVSAISAAAATQIIPCAVGNKWDYSCVKLVRATITHDGKPMASMRDASSGSAVYEVTAVDSSGAKPVYDYVETTDMTSTSSGETDSDKDELKVSTDDQGLRILSTYEEGSDRKEAEKQTYSPPLLYYAKNAGVGATWEVGAMRDGDTTTTVTAKGVGLETVTVAAGTFKDCLKVVYSSDEVSGTIDMWEKQFKLTSGRTRGIYWVAEGVGVVKELEVSTTTAETAGPDGKPVTVEAATCVVSELKPGYVVKK